MQISLVAFTARGCATAQRLADILRAEGDKVTLDQCPDQAGGVAEWTARHFPLSPALVFIGAAAIAVRAVAPHLKGKAGDPAVLVLDEDGEFVIPLLSGHLGGANQLAARLAARLEATLVLTTASDRRGVFAVDSWAREEGLIIPDPAAVKTVTSRLLAGEGVGFFSAFPVRGVLPEGLFLAPRETAGVVLDIHPAPGAALWLVPPLAVLGVGCRRGTPVAAIMAAFREFCREKNFSPLAVRAVTSLDRKHDEAGLLAFARELSLPLSLFSPLELENTPGDFTASAFVKAVTGVDSVAERSAVAASDGGTLHLRKWARERVTLALALAPARLSFPGS
jgi:cobalt-precorrin 5A hydrolase